MQVFKPYLLKQLVQNVTDIAVAQRIHPYKSLEMLIGFMSLNDADRRELIADYKLILKSRSNEFPFAL